MNKTLKMIVLVLSLGLMGVHCGTLQAQPMGKKSIGKRAPNSVPGLALSNKAPRNNDRAQLPRPQSGQGEVDRGSSGRELNVKDRTFDKDTDVVRLPDSRFNTEKPAKPNSVLKKVVF